MAPALNCGTNSWSYFSKGYGTPNCASKNSKPRLVIPNISSASTCSIRERRAYRPRGTVRPSALVSSSCTDA
jgi:hypothetical protein